MTMKGIKTLILQDLPHVLPPKNLQRNRCLVSNPLPFLQMHTTACPRRFWTFFDFSCKGESRSNEKECPESKDIVSSSLLPNLDLDDVSSKPLSSNTIVTTTTTCSPRDSNECDLKSTPMNCPRVQRPLKEESLISLLDGHPVPKMLKWKLKGYKTLRNEQAIDFAFVPGGKSHELDILPRNGVTDNLDDTVQRQGDLTIRKQTGKKDTLRLTAKAIENKVETEAKVIDKIVEKKDESVPDMDNSRNVSNQKLHLSSSVGNEGVKYLPILKSDLKCQTQPAARFSSRPPKKVGKPSAPILKRTDCKRHDSEEELPSMEFDEERDVLEASSLSKPLVPKFSELAGKWSSTENQRNQGYPAKAEETKSDCNSLQPVETTRSRNVSSEVADEKRFEPRSPAYFAPKASKQKPRLSTTDGVTLESIIGIPERTTPRLNITRPGEGRVASSPCAATRARQNGNRSASSSQINSFGNGKSQSVPGNSDGGSRKPPASFPPVTSKRSSSNCSCLLGKTTVSKATSSAPNRVLNSRNSSLNISTSSASPARNCRDDSDECPRARRKSCEQERPCKSDKKTCKRYCCPALQTPTKCDYDMFQCPEDTCGQSLQSHKVKREPTCSSNDECKDQGREFCKTPRKRGENRSCRKERSRPCSERRRSCQREYSQQEDNCSQREQAREISTKPRKRDNSCRRQRKCNDRDCSRRSAKCTGRRNYTQSAFSSRCKVARNVKRYSSLQALVSPLIVTRENLFVSSPIYHPPIRSKSDDKSSRPSSKCKLNIEKCKKEEPCKKMEDPCRKTEGTCDKKEDSCGKKKKPSYKKEDPCKKTRPTCKREDPCKKAETTCGPEVKKVDNPCKKARSMSKTMDDSCKKSSKSKDKLKCSATTDDTCSKKREQICQERKMALSPEDSSESLEDKIERERKEVEDCKKHIKSRNKVKEKKVAAVTGLERVISPCKQQLKDKKAKFASINLPLQSFMNDVSDTCTKQASNLLNLSSDRLYSVVRSSNSDEINRETDPPGPVRNFWSFNEGDVEGISVIDNYPLIDNRDNGPEEGPNWSLSWFTSY